MNGNLCLNGSWSMVGGNTGSKNMVQGSDRVSMPWKLWHVFGVYTLMQSPDLTSVVAFEQNTL